MEERYSKEIDNLQSQIENGMQQTLSTEYEIQEYQDKIHELEAEIKRLVKESESSDEKSSKRLVDESGVMVSASSEFDTDVETKDSGQGTENVVVDQTDSSGGFEIFEKTDEDSEVSGRDLRDSGGVVLDQLDESDKQTANRQDSSADKQRADHRDSSADKQRAERRDSSADLDNTLQDLKGSHAAAIAEIEEEYNSKLASLKTGKRGRS